MDVVSTSSPSLLERQGYERTRDSRFNQQQWSALRELFQTHFHDDVDNKEMFVVCAPGRVNLIGEHVDYCEGFVVPCAMNLNLHLLCRRREDSIVRCVSTSSSADLAMDSKELGESGQSSLPQWDLTQQLDTADLAKSIPRFLEYIVGQGQFFNQQVEGTCLGFDCVISSDIPIGAGLSSSSALCVAAALAFEHVNAYMRGAECTEQQRLERVCSSEWFHSGVRGGIMDQFTLLFATQGSFLQLDCRTQTVAQTVSLGDEHCLIIANTKVKHELVGSPYNDRRANAESATEKVRAHFPNRSIASLRDVTLDMLTSTRWSGPLKQGVEAMSGLEYKRARHVIGEIQRTIDCVAALKSKEFKRVGELMNMSHESLRSDYEVSCVELDMTCELARACDGVLGARMMGAGFGGCCVILCERRASDQIARSLTFKFERAFSVAPELFVMEKPEGRACVYV